MSRTVRVPVAAMMLVAALLVPASALAARHSSPNGRHTVSLLSSENPITFGDPLSAPCETCDSPERLSNFSSSTVSLLTRLVDA